MKEPPQYEREALENMPVGELVEVIVRQQEWAQQIYEEIERLKAVNNRSSKDSSKPPSSDLIKRSEKIDESKEEEEGKKKQGDKSDIKEKREKDLIE
ncbi:transposase IS66 [Pseudanabaena biceps PCC 7429]|uniref:Transposase IS66 n=1 Tax=Pseudanabaena biceps PCC 7429 TaxID=927668 RepID=L8MZP3_9CYAN|nr:transposase IS66 [Pseudanabaena biceps PCC 7429]